MHWRADMHERCSDYDERIQKSARKALARMRRRRTRAYFIGVAIALVTFGTRILWR